MRLTRVYFSSFSALPQNFKSHQRHVSAMRFDKKLAPSLVRHATWKDRRAQSISSEDKGYRGSLQPQKARGEMGTDGEDRAKKWRISDEQRYCQLCDANKQTSRRISNPAGSLRLLHSGPQLLSLLFEMYNALPVLYEEAVLILQKDLKKK